MTLSDCINYAYDNHTEVRVARLKQKDADWQIKENRSVAYPQINLGASFQSFIILPALPLEALGLDFGEPGQKLAFSLRNTLGGNVSVSQLLYNNSYFASIKAAKMYRDYATLQLEAVKEKIRNQVTDAYLPALLIEESLQIFNENIRTQEKLLEETREIYKAGFAEQLDADRLAYVLSLLHTERDALERQHAIVIDALKFQMGMPQSEMIQPADDLDGLLAVYSAIDPEEPLDYSKRPDYLSLMKAREMSDIQVTAQRRAWFPTLSLFGSFDPSFQGNEKLYWIPSAIAGVRLNMPIFNGGLNKARTERAVISAMQLEEQRQLLVKALDFEVQIARNQFKNAQQKQENQTANLELARRIFDTTQKKYAGGVGSSFEVTQAQTDLYQAQSSWLSARYDYLHAIINLRKALGY